jgi:hypothetical protein
LSRLPERASLDVHVWYETDPVDDDAVRLAVARLARAMLAEDAAARVDAAPAAVDAVRLLRRPDLRWRDGRPFATWMEVWPAVAADALAPGLARLAASAEACGATALARDARHVEPFRAVALPSPD